MSESINPTALESLSAALRPRLQEVSALLSSGQTQAALRAAEDGLKDFPHSAELSNLAGICAANLGDHARAEQCWRHSIALAPDNAQAHFNLGLLNANLQRPDQAEHHYRRALALAPRNAAAHSNLGALLANGQRAAEAEQCYRQALALAPGNAMAYFNLGLLLAEQRRSAEAEQCYRQAIALAPRDAPAYFHLGALLAGAERAAEAEQYYRMAIVLAPGNALAHFNLGVLLANGKRDAEAEHCYRQALALDDALALAHTNLGILLARRGQTAAAEQCYRRAIALAPAAAEAYNNLGLLLEEQGRDAEAEHCYRHAIARDPDTAIAHSNLALLLAQQGRDAAAEQCFRQALALNPDYAVARLNLGFLLLRLGRYAEGWPLHEARLAPGLPEENRHPCPIDAPFPQWQGEPLAGKSLLVWPEQGLGDEMQFCRYLPLLKRQGAARITLVCKPPLKALLETLEGVDEVIAFAAAATAITPHDYWTYPLSLPLHCRTELATIPNQLPYLSVPPQRLAQWAARLPQGGLRVGLVWKGSALHKNDRRRSLPDLAALAPLWTVPGVHFISLQKGRGEDEARHPPAGQALLHLGDGIADFADTAAVVAQLDLVISVDTAVAHLAGALAKPCWVLLTAYGTDWRWLQGRDDSPWYPGVMRLFRQRRRGDWTPPVMAIRDALRDAALQRPRHN